MIVSSENVLHSIVDVLHTHRDWIGWYSLQEPVRGSGVGTLLVHNVFAN
jgi:hypothetical protein